MNSSLFNDLGQENKISHDEIFEFFQKNNCINGNKLEKITSEDLQITDAEHRLSALYFSLKNTKKSPQNNDISQLIKNAKCIFENQILDLSRTEDIAIKDFKEIKFVNTIVFGNIYIQADPKYRGFEKVSIVFDNTIVFGTIDIRCFSNENTTVSLWKCAADGLFLGGSDSFEKVEINYSCFGLIELFSTFKMIDCYGSSIEAIRINNAIIKNRKFTANKINWKNSIDLTKKDFKWKRIHIRTPEQKNDEKKAQQKKVQRSTILFFKSISDELTFKDYVNMQIKEQDLDGNFTSKVMSRLALLLTQPLKIFMLMVIIIVAFSVIFYVAEPNFSILCAFYHSTITFTTIGYSDYTTTVLSKIFSIIEGIAGICSSGAYLIALTQKYLDRKS